MKNCLFLVLALMAFTGCRTPLEKATQNIVPAGPDTYTITYTGNYYSEVRTVVYQAANQHCTSKLLGFSPQNEDQRDGIITDRIGKLRPSTSVRLIYRCLSKDDPANVRPK